MFSPELRSLSLSPAGLACREGETKSISPASLTFLCAGVEAAGGTDKKISKHTCCWRGHAQSEASVTAVREERPPSREPAITAGCTLRRLRLELTLEGKWASETQTACSCVCSCCNLLYILYIWLLLSVTRCVPLDDTHTCINTQVVSLTEVYNLTNWKKRKRSEYQWPLSVWCTLSKAQPDVQSVSDISDFKFSEWFQKEEHMCRGRSLKVKNRHCVVCSALNAALKNTCIQPHNWSGEITIYHEP